MARRYRQSPDTGSSRVQEASPRYALAPAAPVFQISMGERGRLVLPVEIRERLGIRQGDPLALILEPDGTLLLKTREVALNDLQGSFRHLAPSDHHASDDLIAERRRQARLDDSGSHGRPAAPARPKGRNAR